MRTGKSADAGEKQNRACEREKQRNVSIASTSKRTPMGGDGHEFREKKKV